MSKRKILIVEDEEGLRELITDQLSSLVRNGHYEILEAADGQTALALATAEHFAAIVSDIAMPKMNGLEFVKQLRQQGVDSPVVFLTGFADKEKAVEALRLGAYDFLEKPCPGELLLLTVRRAMQFGSRLKEIEKGLDRILTNLQSLSEEQRAELKASQKALFLEQMAEEILRHKKAS